MLRVTHVGKFYPPVPGGMERIVQSLCHIVRGRVESRVLAFNTGPSTIEDVVDGIPVTRVGTRGSAGSVPISPAFFSRLRAVDADVMVLHEPNPWALLAYAAVRPRVPLAIWFHSDVVRPRLQYQLFYAPIARPAYKQARRFIVSSPALAQHSAVLEEFRHRIDVIPFGIDAAVGCPSNAVRRRAEEIRRQIAGPLVLFAGRHVPYKGVDVLIDAAAALPLTVVIVGDGPMRATWMARARSQRGRAQYLFPGEVDDEELRAHFVASDAFVLPSVTKAEAFGYVQLEAMACGKPVVSTSVPSGVPWVNRDDETGLVVSPGDRQALRAALERLAGDASLRARLGAAGARRVRTDFTLQAMADRFVAVCERVAAGG